LLHSVEGHLVQHISPTTVKQFTILTTTIISTSMSWSRTVGHPCHCSSHCAPGVKAIPCQAITAPAALAAGPAADHIQVGSSDIQGLQHVHSGVPTLPNCRTCLQLKFMFICHPSTGVHPFNRTDFSRHAFRFSTSSLCNSLSKTVLIS